MHEAAMQAILLSVLVRPAGIACSMRKMHMVNPMPPRRPTTPRCVFVIPSGMSARPSFTASHVDPMMPSGLPIDNPRKIPEATFATCFFAATVAPPLAAAVAAAKAAGPTTGMAVFARANRGMMASAQIGFHRRARRCTISVSSFEANTQRPARTPAISAFTPARKRQYQSAAPTGRNNFPIETRRFSMATSMACTHAAAPRKGSEMWWAKHVAMTKIAPMSSTVARVNKKADTDEGNFLLPPKSEKTPIANAISVAMGTTTLDILDVGPPVARMVKAQTATGTSMPPHAAMQGRLAERIEEREPPTTSSLISSPT
mmetsp:Transcript_30457/g.61996  ORF Transcript_30457/g.61996 Transcript_30457/m.61996 type:complete len:316 (-) Transcript_30457:485-1432(-)